MLAYPETTTDPLVIDLIISKWLFLTKMTPKLLAIYECSLGRLPAIDENMFGSETLLLEANTKVKLMLL